MFAGSVLDLEPDTAYDVRFDAVAIRMASPARRPKMVTVRTRPEPKPFAGGRVFHVYPPDFTGEAEPSFEGLMCAYNYTCAGTDWATAGRPRVRPATRSRPRRALQVQPPRVHEQRVGQSHRAARRHLLPDRRRHGGDADRHQRRRRWRGDLRRTGNFALFDVKAADYTYFEGITFRNADIAISAGTQFIAGSKGLTVKRSRFENVGAGDLHELLGLEQLLHRRQLGSSAATIRIASSAGREHFWAQFDGVDGQKFPPVMASYVAVKLYGPGHVVAYNYVANFHDGINVETYGNPDGSSAVDGPQYPARGYWDRRPVAIDFYNNYMTNFHDNPFETDGSMHNVRVMRNMMINSASHAFCNQPALGGPVYWIRNIGYHLPGGSTRLTGGSAGVVFYNNTILSETQARHVERALAEQSHSRRELRAACSASTPSRTTRRRITTGSVRIPGAEYRSSGIRRRSRLRPIIRGR